MRTWGIKRLIATILQAIISLLQSSGDPSLTVASQVLQPFAAGIGAVGLVQASQKGTLSKYTLATLGAVLTIFHFIPILSPYEGVLREISLLIGIAATGEKLGELKTKNEASQYLN